MLNSETSDSFFADFPDFSQEDIITQVFGHDQSVPDLENIVPTLDVNYVPNFYQDWDTKEKQQQPQQQLQQQQPQQQQQLQQQQSQQQAQYLPPSYEEHIQTIENNSNSLESLLAEPIKPAPLPCRRLSEILECINEDKDYRIITEGKHLLTKDYDTKNVNDKVLNVYFLCFLFVNLGFMIIFSAFQILLLPSPHHHPPRQSKKLPSNRRNHRSQSSLKKPSKELHLFCRVSFISAI